MRYGLRLLFSALSLLAACFPAWAQGVTVRVGHFPNITHVQALVARAFERYAAHIVAALSSLPRLLAEADARARGSSGPS